MQFAPSVWKTRVLIAVVAIIPTLISLYLGLYQWGVLQNVWEPLFGDGTKNVLLSDVSHKFTEWIRIPDAMLGFFAYLVDIILALAGSKNRWIDRPWLVCLFGIVIIPIGFVSIILILLQGFVVKAWCFLCLVTAIFSLVLIFFAYNEVSATLMFIYNLYKKSNFKTTFWTFWGYPCHEALQVKKIIEDRKTKNVG